MAWASPDVRAVRALSVLCHSPAYWKVKLVNLDTDATPKQQINNAGWCRAQLHDTAFHTLADRNS